MSARLAVIAMIVEGVVKITTMAMAVAAVVVVVEEGDADVADGEVVMIGTVDRIGTETVRPHLVNEPRMRMNLVGILALGHMRPASTPEVLQVMVAPLP